MKKNRSCIIISGLLWFSAVSAQPFPVGKTSLILHDAGRSNRRIPVTAYYPIVNEGIDKFPVIIFAHGYLLGLKRYTNFSDSLVPEGFILVIPEPEGGLFPSHQSQVEDLVFVSDQITKLAENPSSIFFERIDSRKCFMGFSMGGGSSFVAALQCPDIHAIVTLAPYNTKPSALQAAEYVSIPTLIISGNEDCITPPEEHQIPMYHKSGSRSKTLIRIKGGNHCQMVKKSSTCNFGESFKRCKPGINYIEQQKIIFNYLIPWLQFYLEGNMESARQFDQLIESDGCIEYLRSLPLSVSAQENL